MRQARRAWSDQEREHIAEIRAKAKDFRAWRLANR